MENHNNSLLPDSENPLGSGRKTDEYEMDQRIEQVRKWKCEFASRQDIITWGMARWGVNSRTIDDYCSKATKMNREILLKTSEESLLDAIAAHQHLLSEAYKNNDRKIITAELKQLDFLLGLGRTNIDVTSKGESLVPKIFVQAEYLKKDIEDNL
jgi:hypothetical protein